MAFNLYKNGYFLHCILGFTIYEYFNDFGFYIAILSVIIAAFGKEIYDAIKKNKLGKETIIDILCTIAGCILAILGDILKSMCL